MTLEFILLFQVCFRPWSFLALQDPWVPVTLRPVQKLTIRMHLLKTKAGRVWERERARLTEREGGRGEREGEAERAKERLRE